MSALRAVLDRINDIEATIAQIEGSTSPEDAFAYRLTLGSLETRRNELREELEEITSREFTEICDYRIIPEGPLSYALSAVTSALHEFQDLVTLVFDADPKKPKRRARISPESATKTRFDFGFSYAGSLGVVLTVPNERLIGVGSDLDEAIRIAFDLMKSKTAEDIKNAASHFGPPVVRKLYSWSKTQRDFDLSADIKWKRGREVRSEVLVQSVESTEVCRLIENKSDTTLDALDFTATLVGFNVASRRFTLELPEGDLISGVLDAGFEVTPRTVPARYQAYLVKSTKIHYTIEKEEVSWALVRLEDLN
jgi:hypothetical protein